MFKYDKSTTELIKDFFYHIDLHGEKTFKKQELYAWFNKNYPEIKSWALYLQLAKLTVNANRNYLNPNTDGSDDTLFQIDADTFRLYNKNIDYKPSWFEPEEREQDNAMELFEPYLDPQTLGLGLPWEERGLVTGAPPDAVERYEEFKSYMAFCKGNSVIV